MSIAITGEENAAAPPKRRGLLETLPMGQRITSAQAAARTMIVRRLRIALPVLALVLVGALLLNTRTDVDDTAFLDDFANLDARPEELRMANPRFAGVDDRGYPYEVTAEAAHRAPGEEETVQLVKPKAVTKGVSENTVVSAKTGVFQSEAKILELNDEVILEHVIGADTYILRTNAAVVSIDEETVHTTSAVEGEGATGSLRADSMRAFNNEGRVVFEGNVSMRIFPDKAKAAKSANNNDGEPQ